jgi:DNA processing protein
MYLPEFLRRGFSEPRTAQRIEETKLEMGAYEALWLRPGATFKTVGEWIAAAEDGRASALVDEQEAGRSAREVLRFFAEAGVSNARIKLAAELDFPAKLGDARHPLQAFYYRGDLSLLNTPSVAVVGARQLSTQGAARTRRLVRHLVEDGFTIVSGMAAGTDAVAHATALEMGGRTIAVLGTPIHLVYPRQNAGLQDVVAERFLAISQVPVLLYLGRDWRYNRKFFPERNITMSALTDASIIVEIGDSNGTFIQSKAALDQGRPLFLLNNCFRKKGVTWPAQFIRRGAIRAMDYADIGSRIAHIAKRAGQPVTEVAVPG